MSAAIFRAMLLGFLRDRAALAMAFVLPVLFFLVFAAIFSGAGGEHLRIKVALGDEVGSDASKRLVKALARHSGVVVVGSGLTGDDVRERVRRGSADAGLIVRRDSNDLGELDGLGRPPLALVAEPTRPVAAQVLAGFVQKTYFEALPDVALGSVARLIDEQFVTFTDEQRADLADGLRDLRVRSEEGSSEAGLGELVEREQTEGGGAARNVVAYYAGGVAILFLLFAATHGALTLFDERESGLVDRLLLGPGGTSVLVVGRFLFIVTQGTVQVCVIFLTAFVVHGVRVDARPLGFALVTVASASAAAGLALLVTSVCSTRRQAQTLANIAILIVSAVGGSMVPRFFMPPLLQKLGWLTPNTWALEAYTSLLWRGDPLSAVLLPVSLLLVTAVAGLVVAVLMTRRTETV